MGIYHDQVADAMTQQPANGSAIYLFIGFAFFAVVVWTYLIIYYDGRSIWKYLRSHWARTKHVDRNPEKGAKPKDPHHGPPK